MESMEIGVTGVIALIILVFLGVRVVYAATVVGLFGLVSIIGWESAAGVIGTIPHSKSVSYTLSVLPMFILIGFLAFHAGFTTAVFDAAKKWLGWVPGGLAVASVFALVITLSPGTEDVSRPQISDQTVSSQDLDFYYWLAETQNVNGT